jgi:hypothetical protein
VPVLNFHGSAFCANPRKAIAAESALLIHQASAESGFIAVIGIVRVRSGTILGQAGRLRLLANRPYIGASRNDIKVRALVISGSSKPSCASA